MNKMPAMNFLKCPSAYKSSSIHKELKKIEEHWKRRVELLTEKHTNWVSIVKFSTLKTCIQVAFYRINRLYLGIYKHIHIVYNSI